MPKTRNPAYAMRDSPQNRQAGAYLKQARLSLRLSQESFALALSERLGLVMGAPQISFYESGTHAAPAAVLLAVLEVIGAPLAEPA